MKPARPRRGLILAALFAALVFTGRSARAEGEPRIVLVAPAGDDGIAPRIRAELRALHFEVVDVDAAPGPPSREPLEDAARRSAAMAAVRLVPSSAGVEVWIVDRVTGKTVLREIVSGDAAPASAGATIALRVVELLRASLMELDAPHPPHGEVEPPSRVRELLEPPRAAALSPAPAAIAPQRPLLSIELGPGALLSAGGLRPSAMVSMAAHVRPRDWLGASLFLQMPFVASSVTGPEGAATVRIGLAGLGLRSVLAPPGAPWTPTLGAGISVLWLGVDGKPSPSYTGTSTSLFTVAPYLRAGIGLDLAPHLRARADVLGGATLLRPVVKFDDRVAAVWGVPFFAPSLGLEIVWP